MKKLKIETEPIKPGDILLAPPPILRAFTVATYDDPGKLKAVREYRAPDVDYATEFFHNVTDIVAQQHLLGADVTKGYHSDRQVAIVSKEINEKYAIDAPLIIHTACPQRSNEYPRSQHDTKWLEPFKINEETLETERNQEYDEAIWEMALFVDPDKAFYNYLPGRITRLKKGFRFLVSFDITVLTEAVDAVPMKRL